MCVMTSRAKKDPIISRYHIRERVEEASEADEERRSILISGQSCGLRASVVNVSNLGSVNLGSVLSLRPVLSRLSDFESNICTAWICHHLYRRPNPVLTVVVGYRGVPEGAPKLFRLQSGPGPLTFEGFTWLRISLGFDRLPLGKDLRPFEAPFLRHGHCFRVLITLV